MDTVTTEVRFISKQDVTIQTESATELTEKIPASDQNPRAPHTALVTRVLCMQNCPFFRMAIIKTSCSSFELSRELHYTY